MDTNSESTLKQNEEATVRSMVKKTGESNVVIEDCSDEGEETSVVLTIKAPQPSKLEMKEAEANCSIEEVSEEEEVPGEKIQAGQHEEGKVEVKKTATPNVNDAITTPTKDAPAIVTVVKAKDPEVKQDMAQEEEQSPKEVVKEVGPEGEVEEDTEKEEEEEEEEEEEIEEVQVDANKQKIVKKEQAVEEDGDRTLKVAKEGEPEKEEVDFKAAPEEKTETSDVIDTAEKKAQPEQQQLKTINTEEEENIATLKLREQELLRKQQELTQQIRQQQLLAQKLAEENARIEQMQQMAHQSQQDQERLQQVLDQTQQQQLQSHYRANEDETLSLVKQESQPSVSKYPTYEQFKDDKSSNEKVSSYEESKETSNISRKIDLQKIFTPATDGDEILPRNRKIYASSAFYSPSLHPTVEDQVELARRISDSLSDSTNHTSKGQSMYVNRKKRSVKWVHEGPGGQGHSRVSEKENADEEGTKSINNSEGLEIEAATGEERFTQRTPLRLLMNPRGQVRDFNSLRDTLNTETGLLSPEKSAELVNALQTQKGRGAELFAKRRKKADNWIVDEINMESQVANSNDCIIDAQYQPQRPPISPSVLPAYSDAGRHRVQLKMHQEQVMDKYVKPGLKVVKSPWEAALETGSASSAFLEEQRQSPYSTTPTLSVSPGPAPQYYNVNSAQPGSANVIPKPLESPAYQESLSDQTTIPYRLPQAATYLPSKPSASYGQKELAYKPSIPQGWKAPGMALPKELYIPKDIPLDSYAPPPAVNIKSPLLTATYRPQEQYQPISGSYEASAYKRNIGGSSFPVNTRSTTGTFSTVGSHLYSDGWNSTPKQQYFDSRSYQTAPQASNQAPSVTFNPSPLPYDKLAKFENSSEQTPCYQRSSLGSSKVRNLSPAPFARGYKTNSPIMVYPKPLTQPNSAAYGQNGSRCSTSPYGSSPVPQSQELRFPSERQNFNTSARGWSCSKPSFVQQKLNSCGPQAYMPTPVATNLPYTDF